MMQSDLDTLWSRFRVAINCNINERQRLEATPHDEASEDYLDMLAARLDATAHERFQARVALYAAEVDLADIVQVESQIEHARERSLGVRYG